jgi:hypothetical protein
MCSHRSPLVEVCLRVQPQISRYPSLRQIYFRASGLVSPALFALVAEQVAYSAAFALFGLCALATATLLAFSVKETVGRENL